MRNHRHLSKALTVLAAAASSLSFLATAAPAKAATLVPVTGAGSTWSSPAMDQWVGDVNQYGIKIDFAATGSSDGRTQFKNGTVDFGVSEIPYGVTDNGQYEPPPARSYAYMPIVAGGTSFMYQLHINGQQVTNLRLSGETIAKIFTGNITKWNDAQIVADNPGIVLPAEPIIPIVRSDGSGTTAQLTTWMCKKYANLWDPYCGKAGRVIPCGTTSTYPVVSGYGFIPQQSSTGVAGYITQSQSEGTIGYVEAAYALQPNYPVVKMLNFAGYYSEPTADNVAVALTAAQINSDPTSPKYLTQVLDGVYANPDPRAYLLSSYSYMIIPTAQQAPMTSDKGYTLGKFAYYFLCEGQQSMADLGYSPLPVNLVQAALDQVKKIPGVAVENTNISKCNNPTFDPATGKNKLAETAPQPQACDKRGVTMCPTHTGGASADTYVAKSGVPTATPTAGQTGNPSPGKTTAPGAPSTGKPTTGPTSGSPGTATTPGTPPTGPAQGTGGAGVSSTPAAGGSNGSAGSGGAGGPAGSGGVVQGQPAADLFGDAPAPGGNGAAVAAQGGGLQPIRAVTVSVATSTGWSLQDTLMVVAVAVFVLLTLAPPLVAVRLRRKAS
ncbi:MAG: phosphate transport system substrate-binding protein [Frankiales bacterium]|nr:phosphate transport system substrate-binding protein [Frankiales bacterium]